MRIGYFGGPTYLPTQPPAWEEVADHVNLGWVGTWACDPATLTDWHIRSIKAGVALGIVEWVLGIDVLVYVQPGWGVNQNAAANVRAYLAALRDAGVLQYVTVLYPIDEPNGLVTEPTIVAVNGLIRGALFEFQRSDIKLGVIYGGLERPTWWHRFLTKWLHIGHWLDKAPLVGLWEYDIVAADAYELGTEILAQYDRLLRKLKPDQQVMLVVGVSNGGGKQDPAPYVAWAQAHADRVYAVIFFTWFDDDGGGGVQIPGTGARSNYMAEICRAAGKAFCGK